MSSRKDAVSEVERAIYREAREKGKLSWKEISQCMLSRGHDLTPVVLAKYSNAINMPSELTRKPVLSRIGNLAKKERYSYVCVYI
jgi:hypothetical protein